MNATTAKTIRGGSLPRRLLALFLALAAAIALSLAVAPGMALAENLAISMSASPTTARPGDTVTVNLLVINLNDSEVIVSKASESNGLVKLTLNPKTLEKDQSASASDEYEVTEGDLAAGEVVFNVRIEYVYDGRAFTCDTECTVKVKDTATVTIAGKKSSVPYDGKEHSVSGYDVDISNPLYTKADFKFSGTADAEGTDAGTYHMGLATGQFTNTNPNFEVAFEVTDGSLEVTKAPLTITANDQEYVYNGETQGPGDMAYDDEAEIAEVVTVKGLQGDDELTSVTVDGQGQEVGTYPLEPKGAMVGKDGSLNGNYEISYVNGTLTIKAAPSEEYTVKFVNYDGTVLQSGKVAKGQVPKYEGATPTKPATAECTYEFSGWEPAIAEVTGDATYTAKYTETPKGEPAYKVVSGAGGTWTQGSSTSMTFKVERTVDPETAYSHFTGILVDGKAVPEKDASGKTNWTARSGSVIVELQPSYLATLSAGKHTVTVTFDDADPVSADFTVSAKAATPATGDSLPGATVVLIVVALVALGAAIAAFVVRRRIRG